jgi:hypothetical protein
MRGGSTFADEAARDARPSDRGAIVMRKTICILVMLFAAAAPVQAARSSGKLMRPIAHPPARLMDVSLVEPRGRLAACAGQAMTRGLYARGIGASPAMQERVADLAFVLCMGGPDAR